MAKFDKQFYRQNIGMNQITEKSKYRKKGERCEITRYPMSDHFYN